MKIGTRVKIRSGWVDFYAFFGETGTVVKNRNKHLGIIVEFDEPREFEDGYIQKTFNFNEKDLIEM